MGALGKKPSFVLGATQDQLNQQLAHAQQNYSKYGNDPAKAKGWSDRINQIKGALGTMPSQPTAPTYGSVTDASNVALQGALDRLNQQGAFKADFGDQRQRAEDEAYNALTRRLGPQFDRQEEAFRAQQAAMGVPETSEGFRTQYGDFMQNKRDAYLDAASTAYQKGLDAQNQFFNQAATAYQLPNQQLSALSPFYNTQSQYGLQSQQLQGQKELAALDNKYKLQQINAVPHGRGGGGGGGSTLADKLALINAQQQGDFYNNLVLAGMNNAYRPQGNSAANGFLQGFGQGTSSATLGSLLR